MNIIELLDEHNIEHRTEGHEHCRPGWVQIECPFCSPNSSRFRMGVNIQYLYANCWHCGHKSLTYILSKHLDIPKKEIKNFIDKVHPEKIKKKKHSGTYQEPSGITKLQEPHKYYLRQRGFNARHIEDFWGIRSIGIAPKLQWRLFIPILHHGQLVSWTTRTISKNQKPKYISAALEEESYPHAHLLYGEDFCRHAIVVVEGPTDVWRGGPGFAAIFGLSYTNQQIKRISNYHIRAICLDNHPEAQRVARKIMKLLSPFSGETYNIVLDSKDPGEAKEKEIQRIRKEILE